jgi:hypothetical protein
MAEQHDTPSTTDRELVDALQNRLDGVEYLIRSLALAPNLLFLISQQPVNRNVSENLEYLDFTLRQGFSDLAIEHDECRRLCTALHDRMKAGAAVRST